MASVSLIYPNHHLQENHSPNIQEFKKKLIGDVVKRSLIDAGVKLLCAGAVFFFLATPAGWVGFAVLTPIGIIIGIACRSFTAYCAYKQRVTMDRGAFESSTRFALASKVGDHASAMSFGNFYMMTAGALVHEGGHALAATLLYHNAQPQVVITGLGEGFTSWNGSILSSVGASVGRKTAEFLVHGGGSLISLVIATGFIVTAFSLRQSHPEVSRVLLWSGIISLLQHLAYAISSFLSEVPGHDFIALWGLGLHPVLSILILVGVPLLALLVCCALQKAYSKSHPY